MSSGQNKNQPAAYRIEDGVLYVRSFKTRPDYFRDNAFSGIRKIVFADDITVIPQGYASLYKDLEEIVFPKNCKVLEDSCFSDCVLLQDPVLSEGLESIGSFVFQNDERIRTLHIPRSVRKIAPDAFYFGDSSRLLSIRVDEDNPEYCDIDGVLFTKDLTALSKYPSARRSAHYTVPENVKTICTGAFSHCHYLHHIDLPKELKVIESSAFSFCTQLEELTIPESVEGIPSYAFFCCKNLRKLILPRHAAYLGYESVCNCDRLPQVILPEGISCIDYAAVGGNGRLKELVIPEGVKELNNSALIDDTGLERVVLPSTLEQIWDHAFQRCSRLKEITIPENVEYIDQEAFLGCSRLKLIILKTKHIPDGCFLPDDLKDRVEIVRSV